MLILRKRFKSTVYFSILFILSIVLVGEVNAEIKMTAKKGDTLFKISNEYGVSLKELMHKNNFNDANKLVEGKVIFIPKSNIDSKDKVILNHKVKEGDTLYKIARLYNIKVQDIINLNRLNDSSYLKLGQVIILPEESFKHNNEKPFEKAKQKVNYHQASTNEKVSDVSKIHNVPIEDIISMNQVSITGDIEVGKKLQIRKDKRNSNNTWLIYGPLKVNWQDWRYLKGSYITKVKNKKETSLFLAVNCEKRRMSHTLKNGEWTNWFFSKHDFEHALINDFCDQDLSF